MNKQISIKVFLWMVMIWSAANLFAQAIYMGFNGVPFDGFAMIDSLGNWYYALVIIEVIVWVYVAMYFGKRLHSKINPPAQIQVNH
ncbi:MAG: hypothetical protein CMA41_04895 [Euryarchaeota archaeon]|jgi:hypothetical protein|nr:hypothetical protein [Euryarchaeota archaeon]MBF14801.1 hypothetical protein [Euryarchaeota archaeon]|tara:strand:+ start:165 stop:422 length:258 start_codon:yes stop_codon:yes gene_type:complete